MAVSKMRCVLALACLGVIGTTGQETPTVAPPPTAAQVPTASQVAPTVAPVEPPTQVVPPPTQAQVVPTAGATDPPTIAVTDPPVAPPTQGQAPTTAATEPPTTATTGATDPPTIAVTDPPVSLPTQGQVPTTAATEPPTTAVVPTSTQPAPTAAGGATEPPTVANQPAPTQSQPAPTAAATEPPSVAATDPPTVAPPPTAPLPCFTSLTTLDEVERNATDLDVVRNYVLCADTTFFTGFLTTNGDILGGDKPLTLRKNMHVYCGEIGGGSENNCIISRGSFGLTSIPNNFEPPTVNNNVIVQGVTFENAALYGVLIGLAGGFQFIDCVFDDHQSEVVPVLVEWEGGSVGGGGGNGGGNNGGGNNDGDGGNATVSASASASDGGGPARALESSPGRYDYSPLEKGSSKGATRNLQTATTLKVEFIDCKFTNCVSAPNSRLGLVNLGGDGIDVSFTRCLFQNNNYNVPGINDAFAYGIIVENFGNGPLSFDSTCWIGNKAHGNALAGTYSAAIASVSNDFGVDNEIEYLSALECEFLARIDGSDQTFPNLECADFTADSCAFDIAEPTPAPVEPTPAPTAASVPTQAQVAQPTDGEAAAGGGVEPTAAAITDATSSASVVRFVPGIVAAAMAFAAMYYV